MSNAETFRRQVAGLTRPQILAPVLASLGLALVWGIAFELVRIESVHAEAAATASTKELAETYEAQVVRAVREIDLTLKVVKYGFEREGGRVDLAALKERSLLPPDLVFMVGVADAAGKIVTSTRPLVLTNLAERDFFQEQRLVDSLSVSRPDQDPESGEWVLRFARRLDDDEGFFAGVALLSVGADFFVSGYDAAKLGEQGALALIGTDGIVRARRSGDIVVHGEVVDYATAVPGADEDETRVVLAVNPWDGVRRYTSARQLYDLPLSVLVGLSEAEHLATVQRAARVYYRRATSASAGLILIATLLGRMSWQLAASRRRAIAIKVQHAKQVEHLAYHDGLTGLPNRRLFSQLLQQGIEQARRHDRHLAVLFLDLDRFKAINDTLGHEAGDQLLLEVARRLKAVLRDSDRVARLGGDEFVVLLPELTEATYAATVAQKVISAIAKPFALLGHEFRVTCSVGIATYPHDGLDEQTLTKNADIAMYGAKEGGKNNYQFYSERMNADSLERLTLETALRRALERNEFELHYQAKRDLKSGRINGVEALLRWQHPDLGTVAPMQFIPVAEQTGLIVAIGKWVLKTACRQNVDWQRLGLPRVGMAVNVSARQFADIHLLDDLAEALAGSGMDAALLELEVTESVLMQDTGRSLRTLEVLRNRGIRVAVDDFGIGYSTLASWQRFPLDSVKIHRSLVREIDHAGADPAVAEAILALGRTLSLTVVAQGVETQAQADFLRAHACDELQGFYFDRPLLAADFAEVLRSQGTPVEANGPAAEGGDA